MTINNPQSIRSVIEYVDSHIMPSEDFKQQWEQALSIEDFRLQCKQKLRDSIYG